MKLVLVLCCFAVPAFAQTVSKVNQGASGNQGSWPVAVTPQPCARLLPDAGTPWVSTTVSASSVDVPASQNKNRFYVVICNSKQNATATTLIKCRGDNTAPVMAATNPGDVLGVGDCIVYSTPKGVQQQVKCISDTVTTYVTSFECL